ncbi:MAG: glycosyl hydrolase 53 family protein, partial [Promicromonosporaceae bacterium]|nr:glycosyl hydrolase 53 family protein [Promicromonosporaceae bacterium]
MSHRSKTRPRWQVAATAAATLALGLTGLIAPGAAAAPAEVAPEALTGPGDGFSLGANVLANPGFEDYDLSAWDIQYEVPAGAGEYFGVRHEDDAEQARTGEGSLNWYGPGARLSFTVSQTVPVTADTYFDFSAYFRGGSANLVGQILVDDEVVATTASTGTAAWNVWVPLSLSEVLVPAGSEAVVRIAMDSTANGAWGYLDDVSLRPWILSDVEPVPSDILVERVANLRPDWINAVDIGSVLSLEESGVTWYDFDGSEADIFELFAANGVNMVRIRIWNDPWNREVDPIRGFGGGNTDAARAIEIGRRATEAGMGVAFNFHFSDFWADPGKQMAPRAWVGMTLDQLEVALEAFVRQTLEDAVAAGVDVWHVQLGNENQGGNMIAGVGGSGWARYARLFNAGARAVRDVTPDAQTVAHFTNPHSGFVANATQLHNHNVDVDVIGASYYPFWHGTLANLTNVLSTIRTRYGFEVMVAEVSYAWTAEDGDGHPNTVDATTPTLPYPLTVQGQANAIRNVAQATADADGIGIIWWEPAWTPVGPPDQFENNLLLWEEFGSGWATSYAAIYDPGDAGLWFGGTSWDNQGVFDFEGHPLPTLRLFDYLHTGTVPRQGIVADTTIPTDIIEIISFDGITAADVLAVAPTTVTAVYMDNSRTSVPVVWDVAAIEAALARAQGVYATRLPGIATTSAGPMAAELALTILPVNLARNGGFETVPHGWSSSGTCGSLQHRNYNNRSGNLSITWNGATNCRFFQDVEITETGYHAFQGFNQGSHQHNAYFTAYMIVDGVETRGEPMPVGGWLTWQRPRVEGVFIEAGQTVRIGMHITANSGVWGTMDDFHLYFQGVELGTPVEPMEVAIHGEPVVGGQLTTEVLNVANPALQSRVQWLVDGEPFGEPISLSNIALPATLAITADLAGAYVTAQVAVTQPGTGVFDYLPIPAGVRIGAAQTGPVLSEIHVNAVENLRPDFVFGSDVSSVLSQEASGVTWYGHDGEQVDLFEALADGGHNLIRIRIWNDPWNRTFDPPRGFGGGNNDVERAIEIGLRATEAGMGVMLNFHYSDFWADPSKQQSPRAWESMNIVEREQALFQFTYDSVRAALEAGVDVWQVQVGNETNNGIAGTTSIADRVRLIDAGARAVRLLEAEFDHPMQVVVHFTNPDTNFAGWASLLDQHGVDYDVFGASYYSFWHGTIDNLRTVLTNIRQNYGVEVLVTETSHPWTTANGDGHGNSVPGGAAQMVHPISIQGQANAIQEVAQATADADGIGIILWEPAWTPVSRNGRAYNLPIWEEHGSGWASSYAGIFDPDDAGRFWGGSSWDNQGLFDHDGRALPTLNIMNYLRHGAYTATGIVVEAIAPSTHTMNFVQGMTVDTLLAALPTTAEAIRTDNSRLDLPVTWNQTQLASAITATASTGGIRNFQIQGVVEADGENFTATLALTFLPANLVLNHSFEEDDLSMWRAIYDLGGEGWTGVRNSNVRTGELAWGWWDGAPFDLTLQQDIDIEHSGLHTFEAFFTGGDGTPNAGWLRVYVNGEFVAESGGNRTLPGWGNWRNPSIAGIRAYAGDVLTISLRVTGAAGVWGSIDDVFVFLTEPIDDQPDLPLVSITGEPEVGETLTAVITGHSGSALPHFQWIADGEPIDGATASTLLVTADLAGSDVTVEVVLVQPGTGHRTYLVRPTAVPIAGLPPVMCEYDGLEHLSADDPLCVYPGDGVEPGSNADRLAIRRGNQFFKSFELAGGNADINFTFGRVGDEVFMGDWNGNGIDTPAIRRGNQFDLTNTQQGGWAE